MYIICATTPTQPPSKVTLVPLEWNSAWGLELTWLKVHQLQWKESSGIRVCVRPLFNYTDIFRIVEFIAYYEALGVTHFHIL
ncbi:glycosyltransferase family 92 protein [Caerostris extrusa]|uniref:Glycosyltransferase family 92 protein n=1 Tax=Caerostris extrusa TaxID=172846 RepID=A0AAV4QEF3_CAEEX|nr:glycosyltransferase family 92 protein [Caerostris extrusa]